MEASLPAQPDPPASAVPQHTLRRVKRNRPKSNRQRAIDWVRALHIPTYYPVCDEKWSGQRVYDPPGLKAILLYLAMWCGPSYGFEPPAALHPFTDKKGEEHQGLLIDLGININTYRKRMSALGRLGLVERTKLGGNQYQTTWTFYKLKVPPIQTSYQERLPSQEFRTRLTNREDTPMPEGHGSRDTPMPEGHGSRDTPMPEGHGSCDTPMPEGHGSCDDPYNNSSNRNHTSNGSSSPSSTRSSSSGTDARNKPSQFCSNLLAALASLRLTNFTAAALTFVDDYVPLFIEATGKEPGEREAEYIAKRTLEFLSNTGAWDEPYRFLPFIEGVVSTVFTTGMTSALRDPEPKPMSQPEAQLREEAQANWAILHTGHTPNAVSALNPGEIWDAALGELQRQVARPAFETWLRDTGGVGITDGEFYVGTANEFVSEMLEHRMYSLIERAVEHVVDSPLSIRFVVVPSNIDHTKCPLCEEKR